MSVKMYNEDYINETAKAIQKLTGRTEKMKVSEFAEAINTYIEPNDLTNVHQVKITITEVNPGYSFTLNGIHFFNNVSEEEYVYGSLDTVSVTGVTSISRDINNIKWKSDVVFYSYTLPVTLTISFPAGIDLTYFNELQIRGGCNGNYQAPIKTMNMDVRSGTSDYFTRIISEAHPKYVFAQGTYNDGYNRMVLDIGHKNYRYVRMLIHVNGYNVSSIGTADWDQSNFIGSFLQFCNDHTHFSYPLDSVVTSNTSNAIKPVSNILSPNPASWDYNWYIRGTRTSDVLYISIDTIEGFDLNVFNYVRLYKNAIASSDPNSYGACPLRISLLFTNDKYFISSTTLVNNESVNINADPGMPCFIKQLV